MSERRSGRGAISHRDRVRGVLLGGAVGDALGAPVEFLSYARIRQRFGKLGLQAYAPAYGRIGSITDDTQMTLFVAEGLMQVALEQDASAESDRALSAWVGSHLRWLETQGLLNPAVNGYPPQTWLSRNAELRHARAPGRTCVAALQSVSPDSPEPASNTSKGCGTVMRIAPVGLVFPHSPGCAPEGRRYEWAKDISALTHCHPTGQIAAGAFAEIIGRLVGGEPLLTAINAAKALVREEVSGSETMEAIERAESHADKPGNAVHTIHALGGGWVAEEALAIALYCALKAESFEHGVLLAVNHDGDSDSTGSLAGQLLGAIGGVRAIPRELLKNLELREAIQQVADDLASYRNVLRLKDAKRLAALRTRYTPELQDH